MVIPISRSCRDRTRDLGKDRDSSDGPKKETEHSRRVYDDVTGASHSAFGPKLISAAMTMIRERERFVRNETRALARSDAVH